MCRAREYHSKDILVRVSEALKNQDFTTMIALKLRKGTSKWLQSVKVLLYFVNVLLLLYNHL